LEVAEVRAENNWLEDASPEIGGADRHPSDSQQQAPKSCVVESMGFEGGGGFHRADIIGNAPYTER
jgi:hypothetical protein